MAPSNLISLGPLGISRSMSLQRRLFQYLQGKRLHPACILSLPSSQDRLVVAQKIAQLLFCQNKNEMAQPCGHCKPCYKVLKQIHPDLLLVHPDEEEGAGHIKIDQIRQICGQMELTPVEAPLKICIIQDADRMNVAAANALLKTLEEPGQGRFFWLLTSHVGTLLPTLLSRCLKFLGEPDPTALPFSPESWTLAQSSWEAFQKNKNMRALLSALSSKESVQALLYQLQTHWRDQVFAEPKGPQLYSYLNRFDASLALEARLRSNANYSLMLESFLMNPSAE